MNKTLVTKMNKHIADLYLLYAKTHNLHWNVVGKQFKPVHEYLEAVYDELSEQMDAVAEQLKMNGLYPVASAKECLAISTVNELESKDYSVEEAIKIVVEDLKALSAGAADIRKEAGKEDAFVVVNLMEDHITGYTKHLWFLSSMLK